MIISKPQTHSLISFLLFLLITFGVLALNIRLLIIDPTPAWYTYLVIALLAPIGVFVIFKVFIRYKSVRLGNNLIEISFPVLFRHVRYPLEQIKYWKENEIKTGKESTYKELEIRFTDNARITMGHREVTEYTRIMQYLSQKVPKKKSG